MANTYAPFGLRQFGRQEGSSPTAGLTRMFILSSDTNTYFTGDPVIPSTVAGAQGYLTLPASGSATGQPLAGIFLGCEYYSATVGRVVWNSYFPGSVGSSSPVNAYVSNDTDQLWIAQCSTDTVIGSSVIGMNIGYISTSQSGGNTLSGISGVALRSTSVVSTAAAPFRIVDVYSNYAPPGTNGTDNTSAGAIVVVQLNNTIRRNLTGVST